MLKLTDKPPDEAEVARAIEAASDAILVYTKRTFTQSTGDRYFAGAQDTAAGQVLAIDDAVAVTDVWDMGTDPDWSRTDRLVYEYEPERYPEIISSPALRPPWAPARTVNPRSPGPLAFVLLPQTAGGREPFTALLLPVCPTGTVRVTGTWGWPVVPDDIRQAAIQQSASWYTLDSSRVSDSWADEFRGGTRQSGQPVPRGLLYGVRDTIRPYRRVSMA